MGQVYNSVFKGINIILNFDNYIIGERICAWSIFFFDFLKFCSC